MGHALAASLIFSFLPLFLPSTENSAGRGHRTSIQDATMGRPWAIHLANWRSGDNAPRSFRMTAGEPFLFRRRRGTIPRLTVLVALLTLVSTFASAQTPRVLNLQGYGTDETFATDAFEDATGVSVVHEYFNYEQEMPIKLRTNSGVYDMVLINSAFTDQAAEDGLIQAIDPKKIDNTSDLIPEMAASENLRVDNAIYGIP